ncbi:30-kDa cleavage and polyadenylation specificity factor 30 [Tanacetum coccineum]
MSVLLFPQGCARMASKTSGFVGGGNWKYEHGTAHYRRNFGVRWLKLCELSFHKTRHLRNPYNENLPVKISRDCQELEPSIGEQLASLLYLEPDSELMAISLAVEAKREEEKAKGVNPENATENPDIVPFEDNEEEEEEESEEDEDNFEPGGGFGMLMGPGPRRGPFMGLAGRGARPPFSQQQQTLQSSQNSARSKRDQPSGGGSQTMGQDRHDDETQPGGENTFKNGESESEDEAPRRSRHGEGKKKRRSLEGDAATTSDDKT